MVFRILSLVLYPWTWDKMIEYPSTKSIVYRKVTGPFLRVFIQVFIFRTGFLGMCWTRGGLDVTDVPCCVCQVKVVWVRVHPCHWMTDISQANSRRDDRVWKILTVQYINPRHSALLFLSVNTTQHMACCLPRHSKIYEVSAENTWPNHNLTTDSNSTRAEKLKVLQLKNINGFFFPIVHRCLWVWGRVQMKPSEHS